ELSQRLREERLEREAMESYRGGQNGGVQYSDSTQYSDSGYYRTYYPPTYTYIPRNRGSAFKYNGFRRNKRRGVIKYRGYIGPQRTKRRTNRRTTTFGPSRRLTRQNRIKSRRSDIRNFRPGVSITPRRN
ncbi:MAG: hypothetical protein HKN25_10080, partial [Pyrinomonadaceae bacterium]|nr:hypothetical protein [Pyrinomonadaceae bacterium]